MNELINSVTDYVAGSFASTFIFGVLTGWLIEWLFYNFVWKSHSTSGDSSEASHAQKAPEKTELEAKSNSEKSIKSKQKMESKVSEAEDNAIKPNTEAKVVVEKEAEKEQIISKEKPEPSKKVKEVEETKADDLTQLLGIGPSMSKRLQEIGVNSFKKLSELSITELTEKLIANGARINNKGIMESWADQSRLADAGDFNALKSLQNKLKK